jgi:hypothetical protein
MRACQCEVVACVSELSICHASCIREARLFCGGRASGVWKPKSFEVIEIQLGDFTFAKDANRVYQGCKELVGADPKTFKIEFTAGVGYKMYDKGNVWFEVNENFNSL